jgi:hypothetical protein
VFLGGVGALGVLRGGGVCEGGVYLFPGGGGGGGLGAPEAGLAF